MTEESIKEVDKLLCKKSYYVSTKGDFINSTSVDLTEYVLFNLTRKQ